MSALQATFEPYPFPIVRGLGDRVFDDQDRAYWDFYGGHCVCLTGHGHPRLLEALRKQAEALIFYSTAATIPVREAAADALVAFAGRPDARVFFCNSGAEANENALKMAVKLSGRRKFLAFEGAFHGRTAFALAVTDAPKLSGYLAGMLPEVIRLPFGDMEALKAADLRDVAAAIVEPIQSTAGVREADAEWYALLRRRCDEGGAFLVFDEVQTGLGRLGAPFAANVYGVRPDMTTLAKGLASGVPMGALMMEPLVAQRLNLGDLGSTFGGSPLACAALLATLEIVRAEALVVRAREVEQYLREGLAGTLVRGVSGRGLLLGLHAGPVAKALKNFLQEQRILVGASGDPGVLRLLPPLVLSDEAIEALLGAVRAFGEKVVA